MENRSRVNRHGLLSVMLHHMHTVVLFFFACRGCLEELFGTGEGGTVDEGPVVGFLISFCVSLLCACFFFVAACPEWLPRDVGVWLKAGCGGVRVLLSAVL